MSAGRAAAYRPSGSVENVSFWNPKFSLTVHAAQRGGEVLLSWLNHRITPETLKGVSAPGTVVAGDKVVAHEEHVLGH